MTGTLNTKMHWQLCKMLLLACNISSLFIYGFLHFIFFDFPFEAYNETIILVKLFSVASAFALGISFILVLIDLVEYLLKKKQLTFIAVPVKALTVATLILIIILSACNGQPMLSKGVKKDFNTGLVANYTNMEPENVLLVMNDEVIHHTDIPLGESFLLVNDKIKGMKVKEGKVSVGCSLKITDKKGNILLSEKDLFEGHDVFNEKDASYLKCTVSTGKPMQWEEKYDVAVVFWDKYGNGKIENKVSIRCIDMP
jgi:hypothetical protein